METNKNHDDIPKNPPDHKYKNEWKGWGDFLEQIFLIKY